MSDQDIYIQEAIERIQTATEHFVAAARVSAMRVILMQNLIFALNAHPYQLGTICQTMTDKGIAYTNNTPVCLN